LKKGIFFLLLFLFSSFQFIAQGEFLVELDIENNSYTRIGKPVPGVTFIFPSFNTYDENNGRYIFSSSLEEERLYALNSSDGSVAQSPLTQEVKSPEYSNGLDMMFGILPNNLENNKSFVSIDMENGVITQMGIPLPSSSTLVN